MRSVNVLLLLMLSFHEMKSACKYIFIIGYQPRPQGFSLKKWVGRRGNKGKMPGNF